MKKRNPVSKEIEEIRKVTTPILKRNKIAKAGIFGSYARGEAKKKSDIDILIESGKNMSLLGFSHLKSELEEALKRKVDLVDYKTIKPLIKDRILNEEIKLL